MLGLIKAWVEFSHTFLGSRTVLTSGERIDSLTVKIIIQNLSK